jgi:hypothetical protein
MESRHVHPQQRSDIPESREDGSGKKSTSTRTLLSWREESTRRNFSFRRQLRLKERAR